MPAILYGAGSYQRTDGNFPPLRLVNMFVESGVKTSDQQVAIISRPGLGELATVGSGPINGLYCNQGVFDGSVFSLSDSTLYQGTTSRGVIAGTAQVSFAGNDGELLVTRNSTMRSYKAAGIADVTFPDSASVRAVTFIGSLFVAVRGDGAFPGRFYWSDLLDGRTWDGLNYATAERENDDLLDIVALGDNIWLFGESTVEAWAHTGEATLPFTRLENVAFDKGIFGTGAAVRADNGIFFVGSDRSVYRVAETPQRISDHSIEERIIASSTCTLFTFKFEGHEFVAVRLATETLLYDCATGEWCEFQTNGANWIVQCACMAGKVAYLGHESTNQVMGWSEWDDLGDEMERIFTAVCPLEGPVPFDRLRIWCNAGNTELLTGFGSDPYIEMRPSDDAGNSWGAWEQEPLGMQGQYRTLPEWRALGVYDFPGAMFEFRNPYPVPFRVSKVTVNDPPGGRSRA